MTAMASTFAVPGMIDGMAPHVWHGRRPPRIDYRDVLVGGEQHGASGYVALSASHGMSPSPVTTQMWWFPHP